MISISDNDQKILDFLIRNYAKRHTTREIGLKLKLSPAGAYKSLKKLESEKLVFPEKLGTGLFYHMNLENEASFHLACFILSKHSESITELSSHAKAVIKSQNSAMIISHHHDENLLRKAAEKIFPNISISIISDEEFSRKIMLKESELSLLMQNAQVLLGPEYVVRAISRVVR